MIYMNGDVKKSLLSKIISTEQPLLIEVPRARLLFILFAHWTLMYILIVASVWLLVLFTIPFLSIVFVQYYGFSKIWKSHRFSLTLMHALTFAICCTAIISGFSVRQVFFNLLIGFF